MCIYVGVNGQRVSLRNHQQQMTITSSADVTAAEPVTANVKPSVEAVKKTIVPKEKSTAKSVKAKDKNPRRDTPAAPTKPEKKRKQQGKQTLLLLSLHCCSITLVLL